MTVRASSNHNSAARTSGIVLGIVVFLVGIALVCYVFLSARDLLNVPPPSIPTPPPADVTSLATASSAAAAANTPSIASAVGPPLIGFVQHLFILLLMCVAGSVIASRGIELFFKALAVSAAPAEPIVAALPEETT